MRMGALAWLPFWLVDAADEAATSLVWFLTMDVVARCHLGCRFPSLFES
ncbi:hypothetical protein APED_06570 [Acanthopleuribacter pedis]